MAMIGCSPARIARIFWKTRKSKPRLMREISFNSDLWIIEVEDRQGRHFLDLA